MSKITTWIDRTFYSSFTDRWDNGLLRGVIAPLIDDSTVLLDLGAGRGANPDLNFRHHVSRVVGVDPDPAVLENPYLDEAKVQNAPDYKIPYADATFDVVFSNNVIEHVGDIDAYMQEVHRVLKPGGRFVAKTPNTKHYVTLIARMTPHWFHEFYNGLRGRKAHDTFPTTYVCNSKRQVARVSNANGFEVIDLQLIEGRPEYMRLNTLMYLCGLTYERVVNAFSLLESFRGVIIMHLRRR